VLTAETAWSEAARGLDRSGGDAVSGDRDGESSGLPATSRRLVAPLRDSSRLCLVGVKERQFAAEMAIAI
jgi:hypothetical protein